MYFQRPPFITADLFPEAEREIVATISRQLADLGTHIRNFEDALSLFIFVRQRCAEIRATRRQLREDGVQGGERERLMKEHQRIAPWVHIAARDAVMTIFHFGRTMHWVKKNNAAAPTVFELVNRELLREANSLFLSKFKNYEQLRNQTAHQAEISKDPKEFKAKNLKGPFDKHGISASADSQVTIVSALDGDTYIISVNDKTISLELSQESFATLKETERLFYAAYQSVEDYSEKNFMASRPPTPNSPPSENVEG